MPPLPKRRISSRRRGKRRRSQKQSLPNLVKCPHCGQMKSTHVACPNCHRY
ncbi:TPA: 50S ribosomal protein L32 [Candidatus Beckwithbacteria bacterium]|nr:50S ribosomal protein L32 [Candidatus Beckwithbacteria bacterium]HAV66587.1 50S ribosomal protein L32 [Candidatus Beckwithbacteria bacterium]HBU21873.1 50S ribosomal protein L32 [Candidatus Beckwithbacteria bacterium]HCE99859.1 50S ribosomal protein L32 [Candidatus Beckwithbacteria bacterium]HCM44572.1 50S ribosomal protein L32 [Candidatus Beckwithbacteria bacterium]